MNSELRTQAERCTFVPPYLLEQLARSGVAVHACEHTLQIDTRLRQSRATAGAVTEGAPGAIAEGEWAVYSADNAEEMPGKLIRSAGESATGDAAVDECADGLVASLELNTAYQRDSYDDAGATVIATVHYGSNYANAFWEGSQLAFGDGDGEIFDRFTKALDVVAHEFGHAVTQYTAALVYQDQAGALNESLSDVFAACVKQRVKGQSAADADWLIGEGIFMPGVNARALRDMAAPGTAYDDPQLGKDPQPGHMDDYIQTEDDNGGVHLNSGIPNRAFQLAALAIGGNSWEGAGRVWWRAWTQSDIRPNADFAAFAAATIAAAGEHADAVTKAWADVGVSPASSAPTAPPSTPTDGAGVETAAVVRVRRSGGFAGLVTEGSMDAAAPEATGLCAGLDRSHRPAGYEPPHPDGFNYTFDLPGEEPFTLAAHQLDPELLNLAQAVLDHSPKGMER